MISDWFRFPSDDVSFTDLALAPSRRETKPLQTSDMGEDMVMITPAIPIEFFQNQILVFVKQNNFKLLNSICVKVPADTKKNQQ